MHASFHVHSPSVLSAYTIFLSLKGGQRGPRHELFLFQLYKKFTIKKEKTKRAWHGNETGFACYHDFQCALTMVITYIFITKTHWISACLHALACFEQMLQGLEAVLKHAILALMQKPKRYMFAHPKTIYGSYWRRIRNRTRRMRRQVLYVYVKNLCKLLSHVRRMRLHEMLHLCIRQF